MNLQKILDDIVEKYGKNEGYAVPDITWSTENMLSRFGEYQYWNNRIVISNLLNDDEIPERIIGAVVFREYVQQLYGENTPAFLERMEEYAGYERYMADLNSYLDDMTEYPETKPHNLPLDEKEEIVFCYLSHEVNNTENPYWEQFYYLDHAIVGNLPTQILKEFCDRTIKQLVWLVNTNGADYIVGWCKDVIIYSQKQVLNLNQYGQGKADYKLRFSAAEGKLLFPVCAQYALSEIERPEKLRKYGICDGKDIDEFVLHEICLDINAYPFDFVDIGPDDDKIDCIPGIELEDVSRLIEMSRYEENMGQRAIWILNKAVSVEQSYRTYFERAMAFLEYCVFDRAVDDFTRALAYPKPDTDDVYDEAWIRETIANIKETDREFG